MTTTNPNDGRRRIIWSLTIIFILLGVYLAGSHRFERWAGEQLEKAAPAARRVVPLPAKKILRESREHLPVYGEPSQWLARKAASVAYFGVVGLFVLAVRRRRAASLRETLAVAIVSAVGMSAIVEIFEWPEDVADQVFDLASGALGGVIAAIAWWLWRKGRG